MTTQRSRPLTILSWVLQLVAAFILGQTLFFKFTGAPETRALFEVLEMEPTGRYLVATGELIAVVLLLVPRTVTLGALAAAGLMIGAVVSHFTTLGISIDPVALGHPALEPLAGPSLFASAVTALVASLVVLVIRRTEIPVVGARRG